MAVIMGVCTWHAYESTCGVGCSMCLMKLWERRRWFVAVGSAGQPLVASDFTGRDELGFLLIIIGPQEKPEQNLKPRDEDRRRTTRNQGKPKEDQGKAKGNQRKAKRKAKENQRKGKAKRGT